MIKNSKKVRDEKLWSRYVFGKQTSRELSEISKLNKLTIKNNFSKIKLPKKVQQFIYL